MTVDRITMPLSAWEGAVNAWNEAQRNGKEPEDVLTAALSAFHSCWPGAHREIVNGKYSIVLPLPIGWKP